MTNIIIYLPSSIIRQWDLRDVDLSARHSFSVCPIGIGIATVWTVNQHPKPRKNFWSRGNDNSESRKFFLLTFECVHMHLQEDHWTWWYCNLSIVRWALGNDKTLLMLMRNFYGIFVASSSAHHRATAIFPLAIWPLAVDDCEAFSFCSFHDENVVFFATHPGLSPHFFFSFFVGCAQCGEQHLLHVRIDLYPIL